VAELRRTIVEKGPVLMSRAREEWVEVRPAVEEKVKEKLAKIVPGFGARARRDGNEGVAAA
jgi:hypothetical protein